MIRAKITQFGKRIEPAYAFLEHIVYLNIHKCDVNGLTALIKVTAGQVLEEVVREAQQIFGGLGYSKNGRGSRVEQISRDVRVLVVGGGSEEVMTQLAFKQEVRALQGKKKSEPPVPSKI